MIMKLSEYIKELELVIASEGDLDTEGIMIDEGKDKVHLKINGTWMIAYDYK